MILKNLIAILLLIFFASCSTKNESYDSLKSSFLNPPNSAKPGVYWYFMDGNQDKGEMTADLESMKEVGIGHVLFLEVNVGVPQGLVKFLSEDWQNNFTHAVRECERLGIELTLGSGPGWTGSGGPWVKMEESMQHLVASKTEVTGPFKVSQKLEMPKGKNPFFGLAGFTPELREKWEAYYQDVAVIAFPRVENQALLTDTDEKALYYRPPYSSQEGVRQYFKEPVVLAKNYGNNTKGIPTEGIIDITQFMQEDGTLNWEVPEGNWTIMRFGRRNNGAITRPAPMPGLGFEADKMSTEAMKHHLDNFMMPLIEKIQPDSTKKGGWKMIHIDSWEMGAQNWTDDFRKKFKALRGYDPLPYLPVYTGMIVGDVEKSERFLWDLRMVSQELILKNHVEYFKNFGKKYGMGLSIEPYDMNPNTDLDLGSYADVPMCEFWNKGFGFSTGFSTFEGTSIANLYGRPVVAAEAFTSYLEAWKSFPGSIKNQNDWAFCSGINRLVYHTFVHKALGEQYRPGMTMGPYGMHWDRGQTWWDMSGAYHKYVARSQAMLQEGIGVADVLYLIGEGAPNVFLPPSSAVDGNEYLEGYTEYGFDPDKDAIVKDTEKGEKEFMPDRKGYNFDGCSPRILINRASVKEGKVVFEGGASYEILVLPQINSMTPELLRKIEFLVQQGATVIGRPAIQSPSLTNFPTCDNEVKALSKKIWGSLEIPDKETTVDYGKGKILWGGDYSKADGDELYPNYVTTAKYLNSIGVKPDFTADGTVRYIHKKMPETDLYFVSNRTNLQTKVRCEFRVTDAYPELWNPMTGEIRELPEYTQKGGVISIPLQFEEYEAYAIVFSKKLHKEAVKGEKNFYAKKEVQTINGSWDVSFDPKWGGHEKVTFDQLEDWINRPEEGIKYYSGKATYTKTFDCEQAGKGDKLFLNLGKVNNLARVKLNGKDLGVVWTTPWEVEITDAVQEKNNQLEIEVANLWGNRLIGDEAYEDDGIKDGKWPEWVLKDEARPSKRYTFTSYKHYTKDSPLQSSGLLGPVTIQMEVLSNTDSISKYSDGRPEPSMRMDAKDHGIVLKYGDGPNQCDMLGARDVWVFEDKGKGTYYMHYDAAGPLGWLSSLAISKDLINWQKKGPILDLGKPGEDDSKSASYGVTYLDGDQWHMFYLGTPNVSEAPDLIPMFPYLTLKAKANSPTGPWIKQKDVVPFRTAPDTYYSITASPGQIIKNGDEYLQFFSATTEKEGNPCVQRTLGIARTKDLDGSWTVDPQPMVPIEEQIENSTIFYEESIDTWFLFTNHIGIDEGVEFTDAIWVYWSKDLNKWNPKNKAIVLDGNNCSWSNKCIGLPSVVKVDNRLALFYDAPEGNSISHMKRNVGLAWLNLPLSVPKN